ncbi:MAG: 2-dehydropantoate 2-reductase [Gammaproteobacteria bacterium]|nr:2-dehydropantoate 2-reductase [Gammaproteobacteria bacterium]
MSLNITVIGPGAIGGVIASQLQRGGAEINVLATARSARLIRQHGLRVMDSDQVQVTHPRVAEDAAELGVQDVVFVCTKAHALVGAARSFAPLIGPKTLIVPALNGVPWWFFEGFGGTLEGKHLRAVDPEGGIAHHLPPAQCLGCVVYLASWVDADGVIHPAHHKTLVLGKPVSGRKTDSEEHVGDLLEKAGFNVKRTDDIRREVWLKLWGNLTMNPVSALTGATIDRLVGDPQTRQLAMTLMEEARAVAERLGIDLRMSTAERFEQLDGLGAIRHRCCKTFRPAAHWNSTPSSAPWPRSATCWASRRPSSMRCWGWCASWPSRARPNARETLTRRRCVG